jgi:lipoprotein-anchoring transpeptidase ErfK/SrfK
LSHDHSSNNRSALLAMTASVVLLAGLATSAEAFPFDFGQRAAPQPDVRPARPAKAIVTASRDKVASREKSDKAKEGPAEISSKAKGLLSVIISLDKQHLTLYSDGVPIAHSRVSTGQSGHATPMGVFSVIQKDRWHHSNIYNDAPMFYMQRITWSGVAMHQGVVPNYPASHGCIRLPEAFAKQMWGITKLGVRVIIARSEATPLPIENAKLFTIKQAPVEPKIDVKIDVKHDETSADLVQAAYSALAVAANGKVEASGVTATDAAKLGDPAIDAMAYAIVTPRVTATTSSEVVRSAYDTFDTGKPRRAKLAANSATTDVAPLKPGPVSVFVSRKEGKLFVRKGFAPVFDTPVTFAQPDQAIGTHVYTALAVTNDNSTLRWNVVSIPSGSTVRKAEKGKRVEPVGPASTASEALDRVSIPQDAIDRISELMSPGASLIISDQGLSGETGSGTDFIVLTR